MKSAEFRVLSAELKTAHTLAGLLPSAKVLSTQLQNSALSLVNRQIARSIEILPFSPP